jgi:hypothetical protein
MNVLPRWSPAGPSDARCLSIVDAQARLAKLWKYTRGCWQSEGGDGVIESRYFADICPQPTIPHPLDNLTQLRAIGYDDEVDSQAASGPRLGRAGDGRQRSSRANQACRPLRDVAEGIENQIDPADIF